MNACRQFVVRSASVRCMGSSRRILIISEAGKNFEWSINYVFCRCSCKIKSCWSGCTKKFFLLASLNCRVIFRPKRNKPLWRVDSNRKVWTFSCRMLCLSKTRRSLKIRVKGKWVGQSSVNCLEWFPLPNCWKRIKNLMFGGGYRLRMASWTCRRWRMRADDYFYTDFGKKANSIEHIE